MQSEEHGDINFNIMGSFRMHVMIKMYPPLECNLSFQDKIFILGIRLSSLFYVDFFPPHLPLFVSFCTVKTLLKKFKYSRF